MPGRNLRPERLRVDVRRPSLLRRRIFREWSFGRALVRRFGAGWMLLLALLLVGGWLFRSLEPEHGFTFAESTWMTWSLVFGQYTHGFPEALPLQILFFLVPFIGLAVIAQGVVNFALMLRDRRLNERGWSEIMAESSSDHVIVVGLGKLGYRSYTLLRRLGENCVVVEKNLANAFLEEVRRDGTPLLVGDARSDDLLRAANVARARSIIVATNDDLANLEVALDARRMNPGIRVVLRLFDQDMADKVRDGFQIYLAMSQSAISAPAFAMAAVDATIVNSFVVDDRLFVMQRWTVADGGPLAGRTAGDVRNDHGFAVVKLARSGAEEQLFPPPDARLRPGDSLLVQGPYEALVALRARREGASFVVGPPNPVAALR